MRERLRKRVPPAEAGPQRDVLHVVLEFFDAAYLAPKQSELFKKVFAKKKNPDGTRRLKPHEDMKEELFQELVRIPLRMLLGDRYGSNHNQTVVKKRRGKSSSIVAPQKPWNPLATAIRRRAWGKASP